MGLNTNDIHELDVPEEDRAHYSKKTIDIEFDYPIGREELMGIAYRTDFDLSNIARVSGKNMEYVDKIVKKNLFLMLLNQVLVWSVYLWLYYLLPILKYRRW